MNNDRDSHYIPSRLDDKGKFLFWDYDIVVVGMIGVFLGMGLDQRVIGVVLGLLMAAGYSKIKAGKHPGLTNHLNYWLTGLPQPTRLPASYLREFNG